MLKSILRAMASLKLAVVLLVFLAAVLAWATFLEADQGREVAQWYVYGSRWFVGLLAVLGLNILAAALIRFPWTKRQIGFAVTHAGLLVLLVGAIQTFLLGIEGQVTLQEGKRAEKIVLTNRSVVTAIRETDRGRQSTAFSFCPGPVDWPEGRQLDFGVSDGFGIRVLKFYRHARERTAWVADDLDYQGPALRLRLSGASGGTVAEDWLAGTVFGGQAVIGPTMYELLPITEQSMLQDFLQPPTEGLGQAGVLSMHCGGQMVRVPIDENVGEKVPVGDDGIEVEIVEYLPDARPTMSGGFASRGGVPKNPLLELRIHEPDRDEPLRQVAFAKRPLLNLDAVNGRRCPVKFWYHHAGVTPIAGAAFLQTPDGKLYCRSVVEGGHQPAREVDVGSEIELGGQFSIAVVEYLPRAREAVSFLPVDIDTPADSPSEAAALVELVTDSESRQVWLKRNDARYGTQPVFTSQGPMILQFGYDQLPLGYGIELEDFERRFNPGGMGNAAFASRVRVIDPVAGTGQQHNISMNEPLSYGKFTFYQSSFQQSHNGSEVSVLTAAYDPGRVLKYLGSLMICIGTFLMFYMRAYMFRSVPTLFGKSRSMVTSKTDPVVTEADSPREVPGTLKRRPSSRKIATPAAR